MKKSRFTEAQIMGVLRQAACWLAVPDLVLQSRCRTSGECSQVRIIARATLGPKGRTFIRKHKGPLACRLLLFGSNPEA